MDIVVRIHLPSTLDGQKKLGNRIAEEHIKMIKKYIEKLPLENQQKIELWEKVKEEIALRSQLRKSTNKYKSAVNQ